MSLLPPNTATKICSVLSRPRPEISRRALPLRWPTTRAYVAPSDLGVSGEMTAHILHPLTDIRAARRLGLSSQSLQPAVWATTNLGRAMWQSLPSLSPVPAQTSLLQALVACNVTILIHYSSFIKMCNVRLLHGFRGVLTDHYSVLRLTYVDHKKTLLQSSSPHGRPMTSVVPLSRAREAPPC